MPGFGAGTRHNLAIVLLNRQEKAPEALVQIDRLLASEPRNPTYLNLKAVILEAETGDYEEGRRSSTIKC